MSLRRRTREIVEIGGPGDRISRAFDIGIRVLIALNVVAVVVETVPSVSRRFGTGLHVFDVASVAIFTVEYLLRVWSCTADPRYASPVTGRLRFAVTPLAVIDLLAVLPFYLPHLGVDLRVLRGARLFRLFRILKIARYSRSLRTFGRVALRKREELITTAALVGFLILVAASLMYFVERGAQPEAFSSIPAAMWWAVVTLTTVGYGDVYPVTQVGRLLGGLISLFVLGLIALPTAILGAAFVEEMEARRSARRAGRSGRNDAREETGTRPGAPDGEVSADSAAERRCPHCGAVIAGDD